MILKKAGLLALAAALFLPGCATTPTADDAAVVRDFQAQRSHVEVTADGTVVRVLPDRSGLSGPHEQFLLRLSSGGDLTVLVEHNLTIGQRVPVVAGDHIIVHGEYIYTPEGGLIHFTHHDPKGTHQGGFIELNGKRYD